MLCAVFAIPQCGFISFALGKVVIFHWVCGDGSAHARIWSGGGGGSGVARIRYQHIL